VVKPGPSGRFATEFERLSANDHALFATRGEDEETVDEAFRGARSRRLRGQRSIHDDVR